MTKVFLLIKYQGSLACSVTALFFVAGEKMLMSLFSFAYPRRIFLGNLLSETETKKNTKIHEKQPRICIEKVKSYEV